MWLLRTLLLTALVVAFVWVAIENSDPVENVDLFGYEFASVRLFVVMFASALLGFVVGLLMSALRELRLRMQLSSERKERGLLEREVTDLRAAPIEGLSDDDPSRTSSMS
jgi:uncharacterized integral membrane protein